ncbi:hypothetical protein TNCT_431901 [Trichonephila clavata]|uniref:Uncharacterized protein n=1 Tax=Trichonephila clavata TaxID=2740835 RepID=A0A8X6G0A2_TRICU|nr:hypothetical protein TNCT_431901 [Trichonephila clavata]
MSPSVFNTTFFFFPIVIIRLACHTDNYRTQSAQLSFPPSTFGLVGRDPLPQQPGLVFFPCFVSRSSQDPGTWVHSLFRDLGKAVSSLLIGSVLERQREYLIVSSLRIKTSFVQVDRLGET